MGNPGLIQFHLASPGMHPLDVVIVFRFRNSGKRNPSMNVHFMCRIVGVLLFLALDRTSLAELASLEHVRIVIDKEVVVVSKNSERFNLFGFLSTTDERFVVCRFDEKFFGVRWILDAISQIPPSQIPSFENSDGFADFLKIGYIYIRLIL